MENNGIEIEMADMIGKTYFKIATWHNQDYDTDKQKQESLKHVCAEIIQQVLEDAFLQLKGISGTETKIISNDLNKSDSELIDNGVDAITRALIGGR